MRIQAIRNFNTTNQAKSNNVKNNTTLLPYYVKFKGTLPKSIVDNFKMCVYDLDDTLLLGSQTTRDKVLNFSQKTLENGANRLLVYSSSRSLSKIKPLIENKTLAIPDYIVANNGVNIYKNGNGVFTEAEEWSKKLLENFDKKKIRNFMVEVANKHKFSQKEWSKIPKENIPKGQKEFRGSKITEYEVFGSPGNIYFMMAPGMYEKCLPDINNFLVQSGTKAVVNFQNFDSKNLNELERFFSPEIAKDMRNHALPRLKPDGSVDVAIITVKSDKGSATEYLRKSLNLKPDDIFTAGDDVNDASQTNKGYFFAMVANATTGLKNILANASNNPKIIKTANEGADGIWEVIG